MTGRSIPSRPHTPPAYSALDTTQHTQNDGQPDISSANQHGKRKSDGAIHHQSDKKRRLSVLKTFDFEKTPLEIQRKIMGYVEHNVENSKEFADVVCLSPATYQAGKGQLKTLELMHYADKLENMPELTKRLGAFKKIILRAKDEKTPLTGIETAKVIGKLVENSGLLLDTTVDPDTYDIEASTPDNEARKSCLMDLVKLGEGIIESALKPQPGESIAESNAAKAEIVGALFSILPLIPSNEAKEDTFAKLVSIIGTIEGDAAKKECIKESMDHVGFYYLPTEEAKVKGFDSNVKLIDTMTNDTIKKEVINVMQYAILYFQKHPNRVIALDRLVAKIKTMNDDGVRLEAAYSAFDPIKDLDDESKPNAFMNFIEIAPTFKDKDKQVKFTGFMRGNAELHLRDDARDNVLKRLDAIAA